jgi:integrase
MYPEAKLIQRSVGKPWYVQCTIPAEIRPLFKNQKQIKLSTLTTDRKTAEQKKHFIAQEIYDKFDAAQQREKDYDKDYAKSLIEAVAQVIGIKASGSQPPKDFLIADAEFERLTQEIGTPETDEDAERLEGAMVALQEAGRRWEQSNSVFSFSQKNSYKQLCDVKRRMDIAVENVFMDKHGFNAPFSATSLDATGKFGDILIKYHEDNFVSDFWRLKIEAAFMQERLIDEERIKHNEIRPVRMSPNYEHVGFKSFEAWHADELKAKTPEDKIQKWHNLAKVSEVPEVRAAGLEVPAVAGSEGPRIQESIDPFIEAKSWSREKTKNTAIRHLNLIARLLDNPRLIDITERDVVTFAKKYIKEFTAEKGKPPSLGILKDIQSNGSQFMKYWVREEFAENNPFLGVDLKNLGANEVTKSYRPFEKYELEQLFALPMPDEDRLLLSILISTGMRLDEAALLTWDQIRSEDSIRYFSLMDSDNANVIVKNQGSLRKVPIPDVLTLPKRAEGRLFSYSLDADGKAQTSASQRLMKYVRTVTKMETKVVHSLRGNLKDLLRDADVSKELNDFITGHSSGDVAGKYGSGFSLQKRYVAINSVKHPWLS